MRSLLSIVLAAACLAAGLALPNATHAAAPVKVAIIVGPVGSLTPTYLHLAEAAAGAAERHGATVARAYSPNATPANVLAAVADANIVVYFGHGYGHPSPYGGLDTRRQNGWALQGPLARGTHDDGLNGFLEYYGEDWIIANARPAPGFVMIYSNTCYAPGASEGGFAPATPQVAAERVAYYSRKVFTMGGSAYYATDFDRGAADLVDRMLANRRAGYGSIFASDHRFVPGALSTQPHHLSAGQQIWLHRTKYTDGPPNYWYAFAGNPDATPMRSWDPVAPTAALERPEVGLGDVDPWVTPKLRFSEPVTGVDKSTLTLLDAAGERVAAAVVHNPDTGAVRIVPDEELALSARYTIAVKAGITDAAGNRLQAARWSFVTRLDADPLSEPLTVLLAAGTHRIARLGADGTVSRERSLDLDGEARVSASSRTRLPGDAGTWLQLATGPLRGWWVAESPRARVPGRVEEVSIEPMTITVPAADADELSVPARRAPGGAGWRVTVDRRAVIDGRTYLRVADAPDDPNAWIPAPADWPAETAIEDRVLDRHDHQIMGVRLAAGERPAFRFDAAGRVVDRQTIEGGVTGPLLATDATIVVGGRSFHLLRGGELDGWAIGDAGVRLVVPEPGETS